MGDGRVTAAGDRAVRPAIDADLDALVAGARLVFALNADVFTELGAAFPEDLAPAAWRPATGARRRFRRP